MFFNSQPSSACIHLYDEPYKLTSSNPGQFFFNGFIQGGPGEEVTFEITVPYPFATQGARPVHVYEDVGTDGNGCLVPINELANVDAGTVDIAFPDSYTIIGPTGYDAAGNPKAVSRTITLTLPDNGWASTFLYVNFHLDYELKGPKADGPDANTDPDRCEHGSGPICAGW